MRVCVALRLQLFLRMRLRLLYPCLRAWPPCCRSVVGVVVFLDVSGSGRAREVRQRFAGQQVTGHQVESFMSACVDARLFHYVPMLLFDLFRASPCWLAALGGGAFGAEGSLAAVGSIKSGCSSCSADASERGVSPRLEVGGSACFALALRSPGCGCFCLRLDFQVTVSVRGSQGVNPAFLVLAFSTRTLKSSGVPARRVPAGACA